ncbi:MAG: YbgC/FadM family acyl-CoA thioesterase [Geobacteraceae bacterium]|nr:YbgC/FadM family acyl-CoA thioesterase [Geobacteraceae bacterium]
MQFRVYYEDTDAGGVVYHGRYLGFFERGRTEYFRERGFSVQELHDEGTIFPVVRMEIDFRYPARLDDLVQVEVEIASVGNTSFTLLQKLIRVTDEKLLSEAKVTLVCVSEEMKPKRLPTWLKELAGGV